MGNTKSCPECGRFGANKLDGYCKDCYPNRHNLKKEVFLERLFKFQQRSEKTVLGALLEVGAKTADQVKPEDRRSVLNICERRLPRSGRRYFVQSDSVLGESEFKLRKHGEALGGYGVEGGKVGIESG